jgi:hypothetical protein
VEGVAATGRVITSAALIMVTVFSGFALDDVVAIKMMGVGMAIAIAVDATLVRLVVAPRDDGAARRPELVAPRVGAPRPAAGASARRDGTRSRAARRRAAARAGPRLSAARTPGVNVVRCGIALPGTGPLASPAAVEAAARAAGELGYASVWSTSAAVLRAASGVGAVPLGLLLDRPRGPVAVDGLAFVAGAWPDLGPARARWPRPLLLEAGPVPPPPGTADGWCPLLEEAGAGPAPGGVGLLLVRADRVPTAQDVALAVELGAQQVVVGLRAATLDAQLAGFAEAAEALAGQPPKRSACSRTSPATA